MREFASSKILKSVETAFGDKVDVFSFYIFDKNRIRLMTYTRFLSGTYKITTDNNQISKATTISDLQFDRMRLNPSITILPERLAVVDLKVCGGAYKRLEEASKEKGFKMRRII